MSGPVLRVAEMFGPTFQGEGPASGQRALFVRLSGCPLACRWCDTPYTWDRSRFDLAAHSRPVGIGEVLAWARGHPCELVVLTGGEPLAQQHGLAELARALTGEGRRVEVETSGSIRPRTELLGTVHRFVVSPKLANSGLPEDRRIRPEALHAFAASGRAVFKFVACDEEDLDEIALLADAHGLAPVWVMPEGTTEEQVRARLRALAEPVLARGWHLSNRLHIVLWGDERGR
jgi:7-cyano-7-deazaguanosine (preQ0) biosynthesis protein QueE